MVWVEIFRVWIYGPAGIVYGPVGAKDCHPHNKRLEDTLMGRLFACIPGTYIHDVLFHQGSFYEHAYTAVGEEK